MTGSDIIFLGALEAVLVLFTILAVTRDRANRKTDKTQGVEVTVKRGEKSMIALYTVYGAATASMLVLVDKAVGFDGHRVGLILVNFLCLTYLFFLSTWFRNQVFFPAKNHIRKD